MLPLAAIGTTLTHLSSLEGLFKSSELGSSETCCLLFVGWTAFFFLFLLKRICWIPSQFEDVLRSARNAARFGPEIHTKALVACKTVSVEFAVLGAWDESTYDVVMNNVLSLTIDTLIA
jgi:hypothetical protein